jgi:hypothetical protein
MAGVGPGGLCSPQDAGSKRHALTSPQQDGLQSKAKEFSTPLELTPQTMAKDMNTASEYIKKLDNILAKYDTFGDNKYQSYQAVMELISNDLSTLLANAGPEDWKDIYVDRDRAEIKRMILNRTMSLGHEGQGANNASSWREE